MTVPTPSPAANPIPEPGGAWRDLGDDQGAVGHIGVVAGVLDDAGAGAALAPFGERQRKPRAAAARQADRHRVGEPPESSAANAARAAAAAHAPVVQPRRNPG